MLREWRPLLAYSLIEIAIPWVALGNAETRLPSSTTGLLIAAVPLVGLAVAFLSGRAEQLSPTAWLGLALGIAGVAALVGLDVCGSDLGAVGQVGIVVVGYALGPAILARWLAHLPGLGVVALSLTITALLYVPDRARRRRRPERAAQRQGGAVGRRCWRWCARRPRS